MSLSEWKEYKMGDICEITSSKRIFASDYREVGVPFFRGKEIIQKSADEPIKEQLYIEIQKYEELKRKFGAPQKDDILLTSVGTLGVPYIVGKGEEFYFKDGNLTWFRQYIQEVEPKYIFYWLQSQIAKEQLNAITIGSTQQALTIIQLKKLRIKMPQLIEQKEIAATLSALDDKIKLNNRINKTLEEMAQAIFKQWFVDFDFPDENGQPYKSSGGEMEESELGLIPKGWKVGCFSDVIVNIKVSVKSGEHLRGLQYVPIELMPVKQFFLAKSLSYEEAKSSLIKFKENDILVGAMRVYFHRVVVAPFDGITRTTCFVLRPKKSFDLAYCAMLSFQEYTINFANAHSKGSTIPYAVWDNAMDNMPLVIPSESVRKKYNELVMPMIQQLKNAYFEINRLEETRDSLLPKLMSGEIRVPVEEVPSVV